MAGALLFYTFIGAFCALAWLFVSKVREDRLRLQLSDEPLRHDTYGDWPAVPSIDAPRFHDAGDRL